jgi:hypothetical protein
MSPTGSDSANGLTITTPFKTLRGWTGTLRPGDTVLVRGGTQAPAQSGAGSLWSVKVSGTAAAPITIKAYPGEVPVFDGAGVVPAAFQVIGVSYVTLEGLTFTGYRPYMSGVINVSSASHITLRNLHLYGNIGNGPGDSSSDHEVYISNGASNILIDGCTLDGIQGAGVHIYSGTSEAPSSNVTVTNSHISNMGWMGAILVRSNLSGGTFTNNVLSGNGSGLNIAYSTGLIVSGNRITGPLGFVIASNGLAGVGLSETNDCIDSSDPFIVGTSWTLAQWQATGHGTGTHVGTCP